MVRRKTHDAINNTSVEIVALTSVLFLLKLSSYLVFLIFFFLFLKKNLAPSQTVALVTQPVVAKETAVSKLEMPSSLLLEVPALADFNRAWTELTDWLSLLDRVLKAQRVMVGDLEDINEMIIKQKVWGKTDHSWQRFVLKVKTFHKSLNSPRLFPTSFYAVFSHQPTHSSIYSVQSKYDQGNKLMQLSKTAINCTGILGVKKHNP